MSLSQAVIERARKVRLVLMDADGVLTDGRIIVFADGNEARAYHARDGLAVRLGQSGGLAFGVVSGRSSRAVEARALELDFVEIHQKVGAKGDLVDEIARRRGLKPDQICFIGDDIVDVFNVFMNVELRPDGSFTILPPSARKGDYIELRAEMNLLAAVSACPADRNATNDGRAKPLGIKILA